MKWYHSKVGYYVGLDPSYEDIHSTVDGAYSRYNAAKKKYPDFGKMVYLQANPSYLLMKMHRQIFFLICQKII